jgi:CRP-like cAMP-binding protein
MATVKSACSALSLDAAELQDALAHTPKFALMLMSVMFGRLRFLAARLAVRDVAKARGSSRSEPVFDAPTLAALEGKLDHAPIVRFAEGHKIMDGGQPGTTMYIVLEGRVSIAINNKIVDKLVPGGVFGEMALVDQSPRSASAFARTDCALLSINRDTLISMVKSDPAVGMAMMRCVANRVRYMNSLFV